MTNKKIVLITRIWCAKNEDKRKYDKDIKEFICKIYEKLDKIIILVNVEKEIDNHTRDLLEQYNSKVDNKLKIVDVKPWGVASGAFNIGLNKLFTEKEKPSYILIASKEVNFNKKHIDKMLNEFEDNNVLVVGLALKTKLDGLLELEQGHSFDYYVSDALRVPWNTCAMWNTNLFEKNVKSFLNICDYPEILGVRNNIKLQGMEDALAIALALRNNPKLRVKLIEDKDKENWKIKKKDKYKHIMKMKRKSLVYEKYEEMFGKFQKINVEKIEMK